MKKRERPGKTRNKHSYKTHYGKSRELQQIAKKLKVPFKLKG